MKNFLLNVFFSFFLYFSCINSWAGDKFGVIELSPSTLSYGITWNYSDYTEAASLAYRNCYAASNRTARDCTRVLVFKNTCAALALGKSGWGYSHGDNEYDVKKSAVLSCNKYTSACKIVEFVCSY